MTANEGLLTQAAELREHLGKYADGLVGNGDGLYDDDNLPIEQEAADMIDRLVGEIGRLGHVLAASDGVLNHRAARIRELLRGPDHAAVDARVTELLEANNREVERRRLLSASLREMVEVYREGEENAAEPDVIADALQALERAGVPIDAATSFQSRVQSWLMECFGPMIAGDREERNHRFLEESLELVQACGCDAEAAHALVDYVYGRPVGDAPQEVGGVKVTLAALCLAHGFDMDALGETELARISVPETVAKIRGKQAAKPAVGPLPGVYPERDPWEDVRKGDSDPLAPFRKDGGRSI